MGEAPAGGGGRSELEGRLIRRSLEDDAFRQQLLEDPKAAVERELGTPLPEGVEVRAVEESADTVFLVIPGAAPSSAGGDGEIPDEDLEAVAGGWDAGTAGFTCTAEWTRCGAECA